MKVKIGPIAAVMLTAGFTTAATPSLAAEARAVLELFTSQGCNSCPPADAILGEYAKQSDIVALSFPVDYWDYLGWKDTLASHENTARQKAYAEARGDRQVYTPQIVVNGSTHVVGSNRQQIESALKASAPLPVPVTMEAGTDSTMVTVGATQDPGRHKGTIWLALYDDPVTVPIERGENSGKSVTYYNVVRKLRPIAMWKGKEMTIELPKSELDQAKVSRCAVILQTEHDNGLPGPILGAATIDYAH
ncbi:MAG TPA: DUF1223 domain-containing protein [Bauldia sp.]|nr:DUF1223 domain-containing protein [Bauldia sp.]